MELKAESRAESGFPQGTLLPNIRSPGPTRLTVQQMLLSSLPKSHLKIQLLPLSICILHWYMESTVHSSRSSLLFTYLYTDSDRPPTQAFIGLCPLLASSFMPLVSFSSYSAFLFTYRSRIQSTQPRFPNTSSGRQQIAAVSCKPSPCLII
jgi:hypothetical protein